MVKEVVVLRYGHRIVRDERVTSHACLVARAFGADKIIISGNEDESLKTSVEAIVKKWGGSFRVEFTDSWEKTMKEHWKKGFKAVHTTMYGLPINEKHAELRKLNKILLVIGSQKVERRVYELADYNVSVGLQPHSEIAALAIVLDRVFEGKELGKKFTGNIAIVPQSKGKKVVKTGKE